jgi:hypothetical protein
VLIIAVPDDFPELEPEELEPEELEPEELEPEELEPEELEWPHAAANTPSATIGTANFRSRWIILLTLLDRSGP